MTNRGVLPEKHLQVAILELVDMCCELIVNRHSTNPVTLHGEEAAPLDTNFIKQVCNHILLFVVLTENDSLRLLVVLKELAKPIDLRITRKANAFVLARLSLVAKEASANFTEAT